MLHTVRYEESLIGPTDETSGVIFNHNKRGDQMRRSGILTTVIVFSLVLVVVLAVVVLRGGSNGLLEECPEKYSEQLGQTQEQIHYWHLNSPVMMKYWKKEAEVTTEEDYIFVIYKAHSSIHDISGDKQYSFKNGECVKISVAWVGDDVGGTGFKAVLNEFIRLRDVEKLVVGREKNSNTEAQGILKWKTEIELKNDLYKGQVQVTEFKRNKTLLLWLLTFDIEKRRR